MRVDALAQLGDEGRGQLRKASGRCKQSVIRGCPNGETQADELGLSHPEYIGVGSEPREVNHLST